MEFNIDLQTLVKNHFGFDVKVSSFEPPNDIIPFGNIDVVSDGLKMVNGAPVVRQSAIGTPIFDYIKIKKGGYYNFEGKLTTVKPYDFPYECLVEIGQPTMAEETFIKGRVGGSVKEFMGVDDWYITIRGFIINYDSADYPTDAVNAFKELISHPTELQVESPYLNMFDINEMVIMDREIPQIEGALHYQPFTLLCKSNTPYYVEV